MRIPAMPRLRIGAALWMAGLAASLQACGTPPRPCSPGLGSPASVFTLYFGQKIPGRGNLTPVEWQAFLDNTITANLPKGYTVYEANGAWMDPTTRKTSHEPTKTLVVALPAEPESLTAINRIRATYQTRFHQQLVGMTVEQACATF